jgi:hypothetical protein
MFKRGNLRKMLILVLGIISVVALACGLSACGDDEESEPEYGFVCRSESYGNYYIKEIRANSDECIKTLIVPSKITIKGTERKIETVSSLYLDYSSSQPVDLVFSEGIKKVYNITGNVRSVTLPSTFEGNVMRFLNFDYNGVRTQIYVDESNPKYYVEGNCLINKETKTVVLGCGNSVIPSDGSVTTIGKYAFSGCRDIQRITYGEENQPEKPISPADNYVTLNIPKTITTIEDYAFYDCTGIVDVTLPFIGNYSETTYVNSQLANVFGLSDEAYDMSYESYYYSITTVRILGGSLYQSAFSDSYFKKLTTVILPDGITELPSQLFKNCTALQTVVIPDSVKIIGDEAFYGCTSLKSITIGKNVKYIGKNAFTKSGLESVEIDGAYRWYKGEDASEIAYADMQSAEMAAKILLEGAIVQRKDY